jgi:hypothetical protein
MGVGTTATWDDIGQDATWADIGLLTIWDEIAGAVIAGPATVIVTAAVAAGPVIVTPAQIGAPPMTAATLLRARDGETLAIGPIRLPFRTGRGLGGLYTPSAGATARVRIGQSRWSMDRPSIDIAATLAGLDPDTLEPALDTSEGTWVWAAVPAGTLNIDRHRWIEAVVLEADREQAVMSSPLLVEP